MIVVEIQYKGVKAVQLTQGHPLSFKIDLNQTSSLNYSGIKYHWKKRTNSFINFPVFFLQHKIYHTFHVNFNEMNQMSQNCTIK